MSAKRAGAFGRGDLGFSLVVIFPLFLLYSVGILFTDRINGVDFVTGALLNVVDRSRLAYLGLHVGLAVVYLAGVTYLARKRAFRFSRVPPLLLEAAIYALTVGSLIVFVMHNLLGFEALVATQPGIAASSAGTSGDLATRFVMSVGAGVWEELIFRLVLMGGGALVLMTLGLRRGLAVTIALVVSSLAFSAVHHLGPLGDDFSLALFTYRALAGAVFGAIFYFRSLGHAAYAHFFYDVYVLLLLPHTS
ncbi:MAG TPA: CPBP family intramembrane glutamic endopeptidase [Kofleriaceae bacterium]|nr:CPBP family intramembrane glutamic endopeptidase [Kofleriaceae bacterium]